MPKYPTPFVGYFGWIVEDTLHYRDAALFPHTTFGVNRMSVRRTMWVVCIACAFGIAAPTAFAVNVSVLGVNVHAVQRYAPEEWGTLETKLAETKVKWVREEFYWNRIESVAGTYAWGGYDEAVAMYQRQGIDVLGLLDYSATWASTHPSPTTSDDRVFSVPDLTAWGNYVRAVVQRYRGAVHAWEIWNEPDAQHFLRPTAGSTAYLPILKTAYAAIKEVDPTATVVTGGTAGINYAFVKNLYALGGKGFFDAIGVHAYRTLGADFRSSPEKSQFGLHSLDVDLAALNAVIAKYDVGRPIWITEFGWPTHSAGVTEVQQASYFQRATLLAMTQSVQRLFWYDFRNDGIDVGNQEQNFGFYNQDWTAKPIVAAYQEFQTILGESAFSRWEPMLTTRLSDMRTGTFRAEQWQQGALKSSAPARRLATLPSPAGGQRVVLPLYFTNAKGSTFAQLTGNFPRTYAKQLGFWYLGDGNLNDLRVRLVDSQGETFQLTVGPIGMGWQRVTMDLRNPSQRMTSWGTRKNGSIDYPVRLQSILVDASSNTLLKRGSISIGPVFTLSQPAAAFLRFRAPTGNVWAAWSNLTAQRTTVRAPVDRTFELVQAGTAQALSPAAGALTLTLDQRPLFLR